METFHLSFQMALPFFVRSSICNIKSEILSKAQELGKMMVHEAEKAYTAQIQMWMLSLVIRDRSAKIVFLTI